MFRIRGRLAGVACALGLMGTLGGAATAHAGNSPVQHVLLLSVDGLHQADLAWYISNHPGSALAALVTNGRQFTNAHAPVPSDSFPGLMAQVTGGHPRSTGVYYDDSWNRELLPAGTTNCVGVAPGVEVTYFEQADKDQTRLDAGQGLAGLPDSILKMTANPRDVIDPAQLPVDPFTCQPVFPHSYLRVNTIFEVARAAGLRTAWSDKHAAYEIVNGPSGSGVQDEFTPEINSKANASGDWTKDNLLTQQYDSYKVQALLNEIKGFDHSGVTSVGVPAIFGMNFQTVSTAQKLPTSNSRIGGYNPDGSPGLVLQGAMDFIDQKVGALHQALVDNGLDGSTVIILSAKHGQSPVQPAALTRIDDQPIIDKINSDWAALPGNSGKTLVAFNVDDDAMLIWLADRSDAAVASAKASLGSFNSPPLGGSCPVATCGPYGTDVSGAPKAWTTSGLQPAGIYGGQAAADYFGVPRSDARVPDIFGVAQYGVVYTAKKGKIAEHGGAAPQDRDVPLVVSGTPVQNKGVDSRSVETVQVAPTILGLLNVDPNALRAVQLEGTGVLGISTDVANAVVPRLPAAGAHPGNSAAALGLGLIALLMAAVPLARRRRNS